MIQAATSEVECSRLREQDVQRPWGEWAWGVCRTAWSPVWQGLGEQGGNTITFSLELHAVSVPNSACWLSLSPLDRLGERELGARDRAGRLCRSTWW